MTDVATTSVPYRIRFDECGPDGLVRTSALLRYAQDVAWIHSERLGFDRAWYASRGLTWLVRAAALEILRPAPLGTVLEVTTTVTGFRRVWARRLTEGRLPDGDTAYRAHTDWVITDERGSPTRVPSDFPSVFGAPPGPFEPGRVPLPPTPSGATTIAGVVRPQDLDPLAHANNAVYLDYLEEALLASGGDAAAAIVTRPRAVAVEYLVAASAGTRLRGSAWSIDGAWAWRLTDDDDHELARGRLRDGGGLEP